MRIKHIMQAIDTLLSSKEILAVMVYEDGRIHTIKPKVKKVKRRRKKKIRHS